MGDGVSERPEFPDHGYASRFEGGNLVFATARSAANDGSGMAHAFAGRGAQSRNESEDGFGIPG